MRTLFQVESVRDSLPPANALVDSSESCVGVIDNTTPLMVVCMVPGKACTEPICVGSGVCVAGM